VQAERLPAHSQFSEWRPAPARRTSAYLRQPPQERGCRARLPCAVLPGSFVRVGVSPPSPRSALRRMFIPAPAGLVNPRLAFHVHLQLCSKNPTGGSYSRRHEAGQRSFISRL